MAFGSSGMVSGVQRNLFRRGHTAQRISRARNFSLTSHRAADASHHTYFRHDSPAIHYREQTAQNGHSSANAHNQIGELAEGQKWLIFFGGFLTFPIVGLAYYCSDWAVGSKLWKRDVKQLEEQGVAEGSRGLVKSSQNQFMQADNLFRILQRANAETKALHDLVLLWLNPEAGLHATRDTNLLIAHPIKMSDGRRLDSSKAILIRILDKDSKTVVLLLGVDMSGHSGSEQDASLSWCHDYALRSWMDDRAKQLKDDDEAAEHGISLYCYTATSSATSLPGEKGKSWQEARLFPEDLPAGFPLTCLEGVKEETTEQVTCD